jgi:hypothetical protein
MKAGLYKTCAGVIAIALAVAIPVVAAASTTPISNLIVRPQGDFVEMTVIGGGRVMCENFTEPAENGRPFRIVLDFCDADHALGQQTFDALPMSQIARIRTSQFATTPQHIVRVVLDMRGEVTYSTRNEGSSLVVRFVDPNRTFAVWEANPNATNVTPSNSAPTMAVTTPPATKTVTKIETKPEVKAEPAPRMAQTAPPPAKTATNSTPLATHERPKAQTQVVVGAMPETPSKASTKSTEKPVFALQTPAKPALTTPNPAPSAEATTEANFAAPVKAFVVPQVPLVFAPEYLDGTKPMVTETPSPSRGFAISKESLTPEGPKQPTAAERAQAENEAAEAMWASTTGPSANTKTASNRPATSHDNAGDVEGTEVQPPGTLLDRLKTKFFGNQIAPRPYTTVDDAGLQGTERLGPPTPSNDLNREALLERIRQTEERVAAGGSGNDFTDEGGAGGVPTRAILNYDDMGRRDPFAPLVTGLRSGFVTDQLPDIETLRLVGVLHDDVEALALLENVEGYSYIMRAGDKVQNGSLITVQGNRALFKVEDYGWSHVVALQLTPRGTDPSKSLGLAPKSYPKHDDDEQGQRSNSTDNQGSDGE